MSFKEAKLKELDIRRIKGEWTATIEGQQVGIDWSEEIYNGNFDYTYRGTPGKVIFLDVHDGDDPYFSRDKDADKQLMTAMRLTPEHEFIRYMFAYIANPDPQGDDDEVSLAAILQ